MLLDLFAYEALVIPAIRRTGLDSTAVFVMLVLAMSDEGLTVSGLARATHRSRSATREILDKAIILSIVERDARRYTLTIEGRIAVTGRLLDYDVMTRGMVSSPD